jgi:hypothetical protein
MLSPFQTLAKCRKKEMKISQLIFSLWITRSDSGPCDPGTVVYAPFPGVGSMVQATAVSQVIEGYFIVQWTGSPNLCITPTERSKCVVEAAKTYNGMVRKVFSGV